MKFANACALKMKTCLESLAIKPCNGPDFQQAKLSFIALVLTERRNLSGTLPKSACGKSSSCRLSFSAARNAITKATEYVTFGFCFHILVFSPFKLSLNVTWRYVSATLAIRIFQCLAAITRKNSEKRPWIETKWRERGVTCQQLIGNIKHTSKSIVFFHVCCHGFSQGCESLYYTVVYMIIRLNELFLMIFASIFRDTDKISSGAPQTRSPKANLRSKSTSKK